METSLIEQLDKSRYNLYKWVTIGWAMWYGARIAKDLIDSKLIIGIMVGIGAIGWTLWIVNLIRFLKLGKKINSDSKLKEALNNELHHLYQLKSRSCALITVLVTIGIFLVISSFMKVSGLIVCEVTLYTGVLAGSIAALIYNKE